MLTDGKGPTPPLPRPLTHCVESSCEHKDLQTLCHCFCCWSPALGCGRFSPILSYLLGASTNMEFCVFRPHPAAHACPLGLHFTPRACTHPPLERCLPCPSDCTPCGRQRRCGQHMLSLSYSLGKEGGLPLHIISPNSCPKPSATLQNVVQS